MPRHIGRSLQGEQLVVSYMLLPNSTTHALVTKVDTLPLHIQRALISLLESPEAQRTEVLAEVLGRRTYADSGKNMLQILHEMHHLVKMPIEDVVMTPRANVQIPLREVLAALGLVRNEQQEQVQQQQGFNPHMHNQQAAVMEENVGIARNLIIEAEMLEADARSKRARAYSIAPQFDPRSTIVETVVEPTLDESSRDGGLNENPEAASGADAAN